MGVRFSGSFIPVIDDNGFEEVTVEIHDLQGGESLPIRIENIRVYSESEAREPLATIRPARCEVTFLIEDATYEAFIEDLANQVEDRFYIVLSYLGYQVFVGILVHEFLEYDDISYPFSITVNAVDGLTRMKDIDYLDEDGQPYLTNPDEPEAGTYQKAMRCIINCIEKLNLEQIYDQSFDIKRIWVHCNWYASNMLNTSDNPLEQLYINNEVFYERDEDGTYRADKCYVVLEEILKLFNLTITYGRGIYRIDQYSSRNPAGAFYWNYQLDGTPAGTISQSWRKTIDKEKIYPKAIGRFGGLPALRQVKTIYEYDLGTAAVEPDLVYGFGGDTLGAVGASTKVCSVNVNIGGNSLYGGLGIYTVHQDLHPILFRVHFQLMVRSTYTGAIEDYKLHKLKIRIYFNVEGYDVETGEYSFSRTITSTGYNNHMENTPEWLAESAETSINTGGVDFLTPPIYPLGSGVPVTKYYDLGFETTEYPIRPGRIVPKICVALWEVFTPDGTALDVNEYRLEYAISDLRVIYAESSFRAKPTKQKVEFTSAITVGGKDEVTINLKLGDRGKSIGLFLNGKIEPPGGWGVGGGGDKEITQLLADEYHKIRGKPIKLMSRTIIGRENRDIDLLTAFFYCDIYWISLQTEHDLLMQEITGTWWNHTGDYSDPAGSTKRSRAVYSDYNRLDEDREQNLLGARIDQVGRNNEGFVANATEFVVTDFDLPNPDVFTTAQIRQMIDVYINGNKLEYVDPSPGPANQTECSINFANNSITLNASFPLSARHWIQVIKVNG